MCTIEQAITFLQSGDLVAFPTDTVFGLAARMTDAKKIFDIKKRDVTKPLVVLGAKLDDLVPFIDGELGDYASHWPGAVTLIVKAKGIPSSVNCGLATCGFRIPDHDVARTILDATGPLAVTSCNISGEPPPVSSDQITLDVPIVAGRCPLAKPSTVIDVASGTVYRS